MHFTHTRQAYEPLRWQFVTDAMLSTENVLSIETPASDSVSRKPLCHSCISVDLSL